MRSILAIASNTVKQAIRMKTAAVFILLLLVLLPVMGLAMTGDGTLKGRVQSFINYGFSLTTLLLSILTVVASIYSVTSDLTEKQIYTVLTKPVRRFQLLIGKLIGIIALNVFLLVMFSAIIYGITVGMGQYIPASDQERAQLQNEFYTARKSLKPQLPDVAAAVKAEYDKLKETGQLQQLYPGDSKERIISDLTYKKFQAEWSAPPGYEIIWQFDNVRPADPNDDLFVKFKYEVLENPLDLQVAGIWTIGDDRNMIEGPTPIRSLERKDLIRTAREIQTPSDVVAPDGYVAVGFFNDPRLNDTIVIFSLEDGIELLYKAGTFTGNFVRVVLMVLLRLVFLACLGILASTFLSFPVAILLCFVVLACGLMSGFILDSFTHLEKNVSLIYQYTVLPVIHFLPQFDKSSPSEFMVSGMILSWSVFFKMLAVMIGIKSVLLFLAAILIFAYREIARIII